MNIRLPRLIQIIPLLLTAAVCHAKSPLPPNTSALDFTKVVIEDTSHTYHLGPTGARGWIHKVGSRDTPNDFEEYFCNEEARQILITAVEEGSPAHAVLAPGDVILGIGETTFSHNARRAFADAIDEAEREENGGNLRLLRWRPDQPDSEGSKNPGRRQKRNRHPATARNGRLQRDRAV